MKQDHCLSDSLVSFIESGVSIIAAACETGRQPVLGRAVGCAVASDRRSVTVLLADTTCAAVLRAITASGTVAVVFSEPSTHRTLQLKGALTGIAEAGEEAGPVLQRYSTAFTRELQRIGFEEPFVRTLIFCDPADAVAVTFTPSAAFDQAPGPQAGEVLEL